MCCGGCGCYDDDANGSCYLSLSFSLTTF
jgi:hypothetical protein